MEACKHNMVTICTFKKANSFIKQVVVKKCSICGFERIDIRPILPFGLGKEKSLTKKI